MDFDSLIHCTQAQDVWTPRLGYARNFKHNLPHISGLLYYLTINVQLPPRFIVELTVSAFFHPTPPISSRCHAGWQKVSSTNKKVIQYLNIRIDQVQVRAGLHSLTRAPFNVGCLIAGASFSIGFQLAYKSHKWVGKMLGKHLAFRPHFPSTVCRHKNKFEQVIIASRI